MKIEHKIETKVEVEIEGKTEYYITVSQPNEEQLITLFTPGAQMIHFPLSKWDAIKDGVERASRADEVMRKALENV